MKKAFCLAMLLLLAASMVSTSAVAQTTMFHEKDMLISAGIGFGGYGYYGGSPSPPIFGMFEMGVAPKISVGAMVGYSGSSEDFGWGKYSYSYIPFTIRGSYHFLEGQKNMDAYAGAGLGFSIVSSSAEYKDPALQQFAYATTASGSYMYFDLHVGGRYFFSPKFAALAEIGYSALGFARIGITYKLQ